MQLDKPYVLPISDSLTVYQTYQKAQQNPQLNSLKELLAIAAPKMPSEILSNLMTIHSTLNKLKDALTENDIDEQNYLFDGLERQITGLEERAQTLKAYDAQTITSLIDECSNLPQLLRVSENRSVPRDAVFSYAELTWYDAYYDLKNRLSEYRSDVQEAQNVCNYVSEILDYMYSFKYLKATLEVSKNATKEFDSYLQSFDTLYKKAEVELRKLVSISSPIGQAYISEQTILITTDDAEVIADEVEQFNKQKSKQLDPAIVEKFIQSMRFATDDSTTLQEWANRLEIVVNCADANADGRYQETRIAYANDNSVHSIKSWLDSCHSILVEDWLGTMHQLVPLMTELETYFEYNITPEHISVILATNVVPQVQRSMNTIQFMLDGYELREHPDYIVRVHRLLQSNDDIDELSARIQVMHEFIDEVGIVSDSHLKSLPRPMFIISR
jgi:hypothetical protein